MTEIVISLV